MRLVPVNWMNAVHVGTLYQLLQERDPATFISHESMPSPDEHLRFVRSLPFLHWYLIEVEPRYVGAIEVTDRNELGVTILRALRGDGYGSRALRLFLDTHQPLPAIPAVRNGSWLANINPRNEPSRKFFEAMGFSKIQETFRYG